jgi:hypothetical protein
MTRFRLLTTVSVMVGSATSGLANTKVFDNAELGYSIALPSQCRHEEGPGTLEAVCAPDLDLKKSMDVQAAGAILLEIDAEIAPADAKPYAEAEFRQELPEAVCGEGDTAKVRLENVTEQKEGNRLTLTARVICPELRFLGLSERHAEARTVIAGKFRYRLMARYPKADADMAQPLAKAFFGSFKPAP